MKKDISYVPMDSTLEVWLLEKLTREPSKSDCMEDFLSGIRDMISERISSLILGASEEAKLPASTLSDGIMIGELEIHPKNRKVLQKGPEISLTPKEFNVLYFLAQNRGEVFTKKQVYRTVWRDDYLLDDNNIIAFIRKLRKKIEPDPDTPKYILTIWSTGYRSNDQL